MTQPPSSQQPRTSSSAPAQPPTLEQLEAGLPFAARHIGPGGAAQAHMLERLGYASLDALADRAVPASIRIDSPAEGAGPAHPDGLAALGAGASEAQVLAELRALANRNTVLPSMIGLGYSGTITPPVIRRNVLENPAWYTAYTPYQPEISQGRLEALLNFQTVIADLTGLPVAGASLLDEATAAAEAMTLMRRMSKAPANAALVVDADCLPQTIAVVRTRAEPLGLPVVVTDLSAGLPETSPAGGPVPEIFGVLLQYPGASGAVSDPRPLIDAAHTRGALVAVAADLLGLTLLTPPGELGADIALGTTQRFGVPLGFGGPHAAYLAVRQGLERSLPGRIVGLSVDADGAPAYRLALQTREQHIRREKATSNICTAQVLLAVMAGMYAVYHGPDGLRAIASRVHRYAGVLAAGLRAGGVEVVADAFFDTVQARVSGRAGSVVAAARDAGLNLRLVDEDTVGMSTDETTTREHLETVWKAFEVGGQDVEALDAAFVTGTGGSSLPEPLRRRSGYLTAPVFSAHRSETSMLRYLRRLADKDVALDRAMIPLGSCTMKLNATVEMEPISWPGFADIHPFAPAEQTAGYRELIGTLEAQLAAVTGYDAVSLQPNAGSQGELAGLLAIRGYHRARGDSQRDVCLIPSSAHGTNAASAIMAGLKVVVVRCDAEGNVDGADLQAKLDQHADRVAALMVTYPSTHGVYEEGIGDICAAVHEAGGQVYVDGANLNALVGLAQPGRFGADVSHLNLHKTFCIPHGGGGPGVGPVACREHLAAYLPTHPLVEGAGPVSGDVVRTGPVSAAPWGSAGILPISWAYIRLMGAAGLRRATQVAVLNANYVAARLAEHYPVLYTGHADRQGGLVAHECIVDLRAITKQTGVTVEDVAKRLIDYGFHAPTMAFPVPGTLMIEPTESENLEEIDRFCDAMIAIRGEIRRIGAGALPRDDNPLRRAPHTAAVLTGGWDAAYSRAEAVFPAGVAAGATAAAKYWPPVRRIDSAYGDRNLVCSCPPVQDYQDHAE